MSTLLCLCPDERDHPNVAHSPHAITVPCPDRHCDQHTTRGPHWHTILPQPYCPLHRQQAATSPPRSSPTGLEDTHLGDALDAIRLQLAADSDEITLTKTQAKLVADHLTLQP